MTRSKFGSVQAALLAGCMGLGMGGTALAQEAEEKPEPKWYDGITLGAFVDAYGALRSDRNTHAGSPVPPQNATLGYYHEAYTQAEGFALAFAGLDVAYSAEKFGATLSLRFGPGVKRFFAADMGPLGIDYVTQAYATWKPHSKITLDFGQFYTIYGAEVAESWRNVNYSRGGLYYAMQPFWHTGLRANIALHEKFALNALVVNAVNTAFENNKSPSLGIQALLTANENFFLALGYLGALNPRAGGEEGTLFANFENFIDLVSVVTVGDFKLVLNADLNLYRPKGAADTENWWGVSIAPAYSFTSWFGAGLRYEYLSDSANTWLMYKKGQFMDDGMGGQVPLLAKDCSLNTITATLDFKPIPDSAALVLRPEFRYEIASDMYFEDNDKKPTDKFWTAMLGVVVTSMK
jgi:hypothetical protein